MRTAIVQFATGVLLLAHMPRLPDALFGAFLPLAALLAWCRADARGLALLACGFLWALLRAHWVLGGTLPAELEGRVLAVAGQVADLPRVDPERVRFAFRITEARLDGTPIALSGRVRLSWYDRAPRIRAGERWWLAVRLKRPRGLVNPGGRDYERWLFMRGMVATGYVVAAAGNRRLSAGGGPSLHGLRHRLAAAIGEELGGRPSAAMVRALAVGDRSTMTRHQWRTLQATGTSHLVAISGLHVGLLAGLTYVVAVRLWSRVTWLTLWMAAPRAGALAALAAAVAYAALAGFALPTQRALVMLAVLMTGVLLERRVLPSSSLALALGAVLVLDPLAVLGAGFWLSFGAVAVILFGTCGRLSLGARVQGARLWRRWGRVQWLVAVGLIPVTGSWFLEIPLMAPLANLAAVPWTGLLVVPLVLAGAGMMLMAPELGGALLSLAGWAIDGMWWCLEALAGPELMLRPWAAPGGAAVAAAWVGVLLLSAPRGFPGRGLGLVWLLPMMLATPARPGAGDVWVTVLDVGQGLSAVVRTRNRVLVFDAGPRYRQGFDAGRDVVAPYLRHQGIHRVDLLVVSHEHNDHLGGARALMAAVPVAAVMANVPVAGTDARPCRAGEEWRWDGIRFVILHPGDGDPRRGNDGSCVLKVSGPGGRLLLPGDAARGAETAMLARDRAALRAEILVVPHHGARQSSTASFLDAVAPAYALVPAGHGNRYGFPHEEVIQRLAVRHARAFDTGGDGALTLVIDARLGVQAPRRERIADARIWRAPP